MIRRPPRSTLFPLHDALPIYPAAARPVDGPARHDDERDQGDGASRATAERRRARAAQELRALAREPRVRAAPERNARSEEHTSELQSRLHLVCRLLLEKKKNN